jgi:MYXO-CTERM domain-containing protein
MSRSVFFGLMLLPLATACGAGATPSHEDAANVAQRIVNGTPSTSALDSVVMIQIGTDGFCTGTLIAPNLVITARHCVQNMDETTECGTFTTDFAANTLQIGLGVDGSGNGAVGMKTFYDTNTSGCSHDIALIQLDHDIAGAKIQPVRLTALKVGETAKTAGYGDDGSGTPTQGRYERSGLKIDAVGPSSYTYKTQAGQAIPVDVPVGEIVTGESTCFGDSGGPLMDSTGAIIGVTSRGVDNSCVDRPSIYSDTASHADLIKNAAKTAGHPLSDAPTDPGTQNPGGNTGPNNNPGGNTGDNNGNANGGDTGDNGNSTTTKPSNKSSSGPVASSGCSAAPSRDASPLAAIALGVLGLALARRRRRDEVG